MGEALDITLKATDANGKLATCMQWELVFDASEVSADAWNGKMNTNAMKLMNRSHAAWSPNDQPGGHAAGRKEAMGQHLDSMTHLSHRCVPKNKPDYLKKGFDWVAELFPMAFPPTAMSITQLRLSHALLASTGVIWSIDRSCVDDDRLDGFPTIYESCVLTLPGFPHCHWACNQTWSMAPGGIASRGYATRSHHIASPAIALVEFDDLGYGWHGGGVYGDKGCGAKAVTCWFEPASRNFLCEGSAKALFSRNGHLNDPQSAWLQFVILESNHKSFQLIILS